MSRKFWHKILGWFGGFSGRDSRVLGDRGGEGAFSTLRRGSSGRFEAPPGTPVPSASYCPSFLTTVGKPPRGDRGHDTKAEEIERLVQSLPIATVDADKELTREAARLKAVKKLAYADCFAAALARWKKGELYTGDPEFVILCNSG